MNERQIFYFNLEIDGRRDGGVKPVRAKDLATAKQCMAKFPHVTGFELISKEEIPPDILARLTEPFECPDGANFTVVQE